MINIKNAFYYYDSLGQRNRVRNIKNINASTLEFDGIDDYISVPRSIGDDFTIEFKFKTLGGTRADSTLWYGGCGLVDMEVAGLNLRDFGTSITGLGRVCAGASEKFLYTDSPTEFADNQWHHVAFTRSSITGEMQLFVDGILRNSVASSMTGTLNDSNRITLGVLQTLYSGSYFKGELAEIRFWNVVKNSSWITGNINNKMIGSESNLVALYQGDIVNGMLYDKTGNENNGTIYGKTNFFSRIKNLKYKNLDNWNGVIL